MELFLPDFVQTVLNTLHRNGCQAYIVGGCVRDLLVGRTPNDYDVTTDALPETVEELFEHTVPTGITHGTVTVLTDGHPIEVTTFRVEDTYTDFRRPDGVRFVCDVREDLARRDFTVNAMAYNGRDGLIDAFGGEEDLKNRKLRAVGEAKKRFREDALRILRLYRFASQLNFEPTKETADAAIECLPLLSNVSAERIAAELLKTAMGENPQAIEPLLKAGGLNFVGLQYEKPLSQISVLPKKENLRLYALLRQCGANASAVAKRLKFSREKQDYCKILENAEKETLPQSSAELKRRMNRYGAAEITDLLILKEMLDCEPTASLQSELRRIFAVGEPYLLSHLAVNGDDLKNAGYSGEKIGEILACLLETVICDPAMNDREKLSEIINKC